MTWNEFTVDINEDEHEIRLADSDLDETIAYIEYENDVSEIIDNIIDKLISFYDIECDVKFAEETREYFEEFDVSGFGFDPDDYRDYESYDINKLITFALTETISLDHPVYDELAYRAGLSENDWTGDKFVIKCAKIIGYENLEKETVELRNSVDEDLL